MRILFINTGPWGTGSFTLIKCLSKELLKLGHKVKIFFPDTNLESIDQDEYYSNPELYEIWNFPIQTNKATIATFPLMITDPHPRNPNPVTFKELTDEQLSVYEHEIHNQLENLINTFKPDIIECHHIWYPCWIIHQMGLDYIVTAHNSDQKGFCYDQRVQEKAIASAMGAQKIIAVSESVRNEVVKLYHIDESKIIIMANGYDQDVFKEQDLNKQEILRELGISISIDAHIINFAGKLSLTKGIDILLRANKLLDPDMNIHIITMGAGNIDDICESMDIDSYRLDNIHFVGHQTPTGVAKIHNISSLSVMPSRSEGFGISCMEAMACGLPIVTSRSGGPETFAVGEIVDVGSAEQLANGIMKILKLPSVEYQKLHTQALDAVKKFSAPTITQKRLAIYESVFAKNIKL